LKPTVANVGVGGANGNQSPAGVLKSMLEETDGEHRAERAAMKTIEHQPASPVIDGSPVIDVILADDDQDEDAPIKATGS
jgi:hypothetical protein